MKTLKFRPYLIEPILAGTKTVTWRLLDDKNLSAGDEVDFLNWETGEVFARARLVAVREKKLGDVTDMDFNGHERIQNPIEHYRELYGTTVTGDTLVKMINFKLQ